MRRESAVDQKVTPRRGAAVCAAAALIFAAGTLANLGVPVSAPVALNANASSDLGQDLSPRFAMDMQDHWIAVWQSTDSLGGSIGVDTDIFVSRSVNRGASWTAPVPLNTTAGSDSSFTDRLPSISTDNAGTWIAAWECNNSLNGTIGNDQDIVMARSTDNGQTWTAPAPVNANASIDSGNDLDAQIATDGKGVWVAAWRSLDSLSSSIGPDADILVARSVNAGTSWTFPVPLNTNAVADSGQDIRPRLGTDGAGKWIAVWQSNDTLGGSVGNDYDILYSRSADNALTWSAPLPLNSNAASDSRDDMDPCIATDAAGHWVVAWSSEGSLSGLGIDRDILVSRSVNDGQSWTAAGPLNANASSDAGEDNQPSLATDRAGRWVAVWNSTENLGGGIGTDDDVLVSHSTDNGQTWSAPAALNTNAAADSGLDDQTFVQSDARGAWIAAWHSRDSLGATIGTEGDILFARFALPDCNQNTQADERETDCNDNQIPDDCDIAFGTSQDSNSDGVPDECTVSPPPCPADCAPPRNGMVNVNDLLFIINNWAPAGGGGPADIAPATPDGAVNVVDLLAVIQAWGPCP